MATARRDVGPCVARRPAVRPAVVVHRDFLAQATRPRDRGTTTNGARSALAAQDPVRSVGRADARRFEPVGRHSARIVRTSLDLDGVRDGDDDFERFTRAERAQVRESNVRRTSGRAARCCRRGAHLGGRGSGGHRPSSKRRRGAPPRTRHRGRRRGGGAGATEAARASGEDGGGGITATAVEGRLEETRAAAAAARQRAPRSRNSTKTDRIARGALGVPRRSSPGDADREPTPRNSPLGSSSSPRIDASRPGGERPSPSSHAEASRKAAGARAGRARAPRGFRSARERVADASAR